MYKHEEIINGETFSKGTPNGELELVSNKVLTNRIKELESKLRTLEECNDGYKERLENLREVVTDWD